jgi:hypothetical protein
MLRTNTAFCLTCVIHYESIHHLIKPILQVFILIASQTNVQVQVAIAYMTVPDRHDTRFFRFTKQLTVVYNLSGLFNTFIIVFCRQADVVFEALIS